MLETTITITPTFGFGFLHLQTGITPKGNVEVRNFATGIPFGKVTKSAGGWPIYDQEALRSYQATDKESLEAQEVALGGLVVLTR